MSWNPSIDDICKRALRKVGAYAIRQSAPRPEEMDEAKYWLDMLVGHQASRMRSWWLVPTTVTFTITAGTRVYDLTDAIGQANVPDGIEFVVAAYLDDATTGRSLGEINLLRRQEAEALYDASLAAQRPASAYIDRAQRPTMTFVETPDANTTYRVRVVLQSFGPKTVGKGVDRIEQFRAAWNLYLVTGLSAQIGNGPVRKLPADEVRDMKIETASLLADLESYEVHEQQNTPDRVQFFNGI